MIDNISKSIKNNLIYLQLFQKVLFARVMEKEDVTALNRISDICLIALHQVNNAKTVGHNKFDTFVLDSIIPTDSEANSFMAKAIIEIITLPLLPVGIVTKLTTLLNSKDRAAIFKEIELEFKEIKKPCTITIDKQKIEISKLPTCLRKKIFQLLDIKSLTKLNQVSKEWHLLTKPELEYLSLNNKLQDLIGRTKIEQLPHIKIPLHRAGVDKPAGNYFTQPFDSIETPTTALRLEPSKMENQSLALGRDPWGRIYLVLHLCYDNNIESSLVIHPETLEESSCWVGHETFADKTTPKNSLQSYFSRGFTQNNKSLEILNQLLERKSVQFGETEVRLWKSSDSKIFHSLFQLFKCSIFI